jgi:site-specific DNA-adenine methylase
MPNNKSHFLIGYEGNKRQEMDQISKFLEDKLDGIDTIIEPFCGTSAMSYYLSLKYPKRFRYILNDKNEELIQLYHLIKNEEQFNLFLVELNEKVKVIINKESYLEAIKPKTFMSWFISNKIRSFKAGFYYPTYKPKKYDFLKCGIINFLRTENIEVLCCDGTELVKQYQDNKNCMILLDPPYLLSDNSNYKYKDTDVYEYCKKQGLNTIGCFLVFIVEDNTEIQKLFKDNIKHSYSKQYANGREKKTTHIIISNRNYIP